MSLLRCRDAFDDSAGLNSRWMAAISGTAPSRIIPRRADRLWYLTYLVGRGRDLETEQFGAGLPLSTSCTRSGVPSAGRGPQADRVLIVTSPALVDDHPVALGAQRAALAPQELEMRQRLVGRRHHLEAIVGRDREGVERDLVGGHRTAADQLEHGELPHAVEVDQLAGAAAVVLVHRAVRRADEPHVEALHLLVRGEEVAERVLGAVRPETDVGRDLRQQVIADEQDALGLEQEAAVARRVPRRP